MLRRFNEVRAVMPGMSLADAAVSSAALPRFNEVRAVMPGMSAVADVGIGAATLLQ